jgi:hypothetical protein
MISQQLHSLWTVDEPEATPWLRNQDGRNM